MDESAVVVSERVRAEAATRDFPGFFDAEYTRLFRAMAIVTRDLHEAEDLTQDAFARVWERWDRVGKLDDPTGYLYRTALNGHFQAHRRAVRAARRAFTRHSPRDPMEAVDARATLERALLELPARQRAALVVIDLLGYDSASAGRVLGVQAGTVRRLVSLARSRLRDRLEDPT